METIKKLYLEFIKTYSRKKFIYMIFCSLFLATLTVIEPLFFSEIIKQVENFLKDGNFDKNLFTNTVIFWLIFNIIFISFSFYNRFYLVDVSALKNHNRVFNNRVGGILKMNFLEYL